MFSDDYQPWYELAETTTRLNAKGKPYDISNTVSFRDKNLLMARLQAIDHCTVKVQEFLDMRAVLQALGPEAAEGFNDFRATDEYHYELRLVYGKEADDRILVWDTKSHVRTLLGTAYEAAALELLFRLNKIVWTKLDEPTLN